MKLKKVQKMIHRDHNFLKEIKGTEALFSTIYILHCILPLQRELHKQRLYFRQTNLAMPDKFVPSSIAKFVLLNIFYSDFCSVSLQLPLSLVLLNQPLANYQKKINAGRRRRI